MNESVNQTVAVPAPDAAQIPDFLKRQAEANKEVAVQTQEDKSGK